MSGGHLEHPFLSLSRYLVLSLDRLLPNDFRLCSQVTLDFKNPKSPVNIRHYGDLLLHRLPEHFERSGLVPPPWVPLQHLWRFSVALGATDCTHPADVGLHSFYNLLEKDISMRFLHKSIPRHGAIS